MGLEVMVIVLTFILFASGLILAAAVTDFLKLKIPNIISIMLIICFAVAYGANHYLDGDIPFQDLQTHLVTFAATLAVMMTLFFMRLFGGGDAKIISAIALWIGSAGLPLFLMLTSITGGGLALISIILRKTKLGQKLISKLIQRQSLKDGWIGAMAKGTNVVPYGIAIAIGAIVTFRSIGYLP